MSSKWLWGRVRISACEIGQVSGLLISFHYFRQTWKTPGTVRRIRSLNINSFCEVIEENAFKMGSAKFQAIKSPEFLQFVL